MTTADPTVKALPTLDDYFSATRGLADTVRKMFDHPGNVSKADLLGALERYEQTDWRAM